MPVAESPEQTTVPTPPLGSVPSHLPTTFDCINLYTYHPTTVYISQYLALNQSYIQDADNNTVITLDPPIERGAREGIRREGYQDSEDTGIDSR